MMEKQTELVEPKIAVVVKTEPMETDSTFTSGNRRRSARQREIKEEEMKHEGDQQKSPNSTRTWEKFPDPRKRVRDPSLLISLSQFLEDIGTDPDDISFKDSFPGGNVVFYEPRQPMPADMGLRAVKTGKNFQQKTLYTGTSSVVTNGVIGGIKIEKHEDFSCEVKGESDIINVEVENPNGFETNGSGKSSNIVIESGKQNEQEVIGETSDIKIELEKVEGHDCTETNGESSIKKQNDSEAVEAREQDDLDSIRTCNVTMTGSLNEYKTFEDLMEEQKLP